MRHDNNSSAYTESPVPAALLPHAGLVGGSERTSDGVPEAVAPLLPHKWVNLRYVAGFFGVSVDYMRDIQRNLGLPPSKRTIKAQILARYPRMEKVGNYRLWAPTLSKYAPRD